MEHHANIVPWQLVARAHRRDDQGRRAHARRRARPRRAVCGDDAGGEAARRRARVQRARHRQSRCARSAARRASAASSPSSTARRRCRTARSTSPRSAATSTPSPATRCAGPTGTGALWARREHLAAMPPFLGGGEMIKEVRFEGTVFNDAAAQVRGRHAEHRRLHRPGRRGRLPATASAWTRIEAREAGAAGARDRGAATDRRPAHLRHARATRPR